MERDGERFWRGRGKARDKKGKPETLSGERYQCWFIGLSLKAPPKSGYMGLFDPTRILYIFSQKCQINSI